MLFINIIYINETLHYLRNTKTNSIYNFKTGIIFTTTTTTKNGITVASDAVMSFQQHIEFQWKSVIFMPTSIVSHTIFPTMALIVFYLEALSSLHQSWLYGNIHCTIPHTNFLPFINCDCLSTSIVSLHMLLYFLSPIVVVYQPSLYIYCVSFIGLDFNRSKASLEISTFIVLFYILLFFPSLIVIVC